MDKSEVLEVLIDKTIAEEIRKKGLAEIVLRRADAKYRAMIKCPIVGQKAVKNDFSNKIISAALQVNNDKQSNIVNVRKVLRQLNAEERINKLNQFPPAVDTMASQVDGIFQDTKIIQTLSFINVGLSLANLGVSIAGFVIIGKKLNELNEELRKINSKIDNSINIQKNKIISEYQKLLMRVNSISAKIQCADSINLDDFDYLLMDMNVFISEMIRNIYDQALNIELLLKMIFTLLPAYSYLLVEYIRRHYFVKRRVPANYDIYIIIYNELTTRRFREWMEDYYILEQGMHAADAIDVINAQLLLVFNSYVEIRDETELVFALETEEKYLSYDKEINQCARLWLKENIPQIASKSGVDEDVCRKELLKRRDPAERRYRK